jgi:hypothetical protein
MPFTENRYPTDQAIPPELYALYAQTQELVQPSRSYFTVKYGIGKEDASLRLKQTL